MIRDDVVIKDRCYFVIDMKSFFASVECSERGLDPMKTHLVVADESRGEKTVCLAVSPSLKECGVRNRCRLYEIPKDLEYILAPPRMKKYIEYASNIYAIYLKYIDKSDIHVYSIDECIIDASDYLPLYKLTARQFAEKLTKEIYDTLHIPASIGIGTNMYLAKIALDITAKSAPDRLGMLDEAKFIATLSHYRPLTDFWQISTGIAKRLEKYGIFDMCGIRNFSEDILYNEFGINAELLIDHAYGKESCEMRDIKGYKAQSHSISMSQILPCNYTYEEANIVLKEMIQEGCYQLSNLGFSTQSAVVYVGYGDNKGTSCKGSVRFNVITNLYSIISPPILEMFSKIVDKGKFIRKIGFSFGALVPEEQEQYDFFANDITRQKKVVKSVIKLKDKYGKNAVLKGLDLNKKATQKERNEMIGGHKSGETNKDVKK